MYTKEHSPLGSQFSCPECGSGSFTFFIPYKLKPLFFNVGWSSFWKILTQSLICLAFFNELHPTKTLTCKEGFSEEAASAGIDNTGPQHWASLWSHRVCLSLAVWPLAGPPRWLSGKETACWCRRCRGHRFNPRVGKIPWRRGWQPTPVFLPGKSHGQRSLAGYSPRGRRARYGWAHTHARNLQQAPLAPKPSPRTSVSELLIKRSGLLSA